MPSLADRPELIGFFSYSRDDDDDSNGALSALRERIQRELRGQLGRSMKTFRLWQDKEAIAPGKLWEEEIKSSVGQAVFFIPIITPTVVRSPNCRFELEAFLAREAELGRSDLVFPILYIRVPELEDSARNKDDPVLSIIAKRQYLDWREFRHRDIQSPDVKEAIEKFCGNICAALSQSLIPSDEREARDAAVAVPPVLVEPKRPVAETESRDDRAGHIKTEVPARSSKVTLLVLTAIAAVAAIAIWFVIAPSKTVPPTVSAPAIPSSQVVPEPSLRPAATPIPVVPAPPQQPAPPPAPPQALGSATGFIFPDSDRRYLTQDELRRLSSADLRIARNEIFARRGRYFRDPQLAAYFAQFSWYKPYSYDVPLNNIENANVALIQSMEH